MDDQSWLATEFERQRPRLRSVAYRVLGTNDQADDAVQEAWLRLSRSDSAAIDNLAGWLTTVVGRICLDMLRSRASRPERSGEESFDEPVDTATVDPEQQAVDAQFVGMALQVVLETLQPSERLAFVLHDLFAVPFDQIAPILGRSAAATRQLASRGRRRVQGAEPASGQIDQTKQRRVVEAFLAASRSGQFDRLLTLLDPDVVLRADQRAVDRAAAAVGHGAPLLALEVRGADAVATAFNGRAVDARPALIDGSMGFVWVPGGRLRSVFVVTVRGDRIVELDLFSEPVDVAEFQVELV